MEKWWAKLENKCRKCKKYQAEELVKETENWFYWVCKFCGHKRKHERSWAEYKMKNGKTFLRTNENKYQEVELKRFENYLKVVPVSPQLKLDTPVNNFPLTHLDEFDNIQNRKSNTHKNATSSKNQQK